jgi:hypothetical protein
VPSGTQHFILLSDCVPKGTHFISCHKTFYPYNVPAGQLRQRYGYSKYIIKPFIHPSTDEDGKGLFLMSVEDEKE